MAAPGLVSPDSFPIRQPTDKSQMNGKMVNPPRYIEIGGISGSQVWFKPNRPEGFQQSPQSNVARVEKPTSVKSAHRSSREND